MVLHNLGACYMFQAGRRFYINLPERLLYFMAGKGKRFDFHGAFAKKEDAVRKEKEVGGFIRERKINGHVRYFVLTAHDK